MNSGANFSERFKQRVAAIDYLTEPPKPRYDIPTEVIVPSPIGEEPQVVEANTLEQPAGVPLFAIYKQTVSGTSRGLVFGLTREEAEKEYTKLNEKEQKRRNVEMMNAHEKGLEHKPLSCELVLYEIVEQDSKEQRSAFFNPRPFVKEEAND